MNLMSQEGDQFQVEVKVAKMSELVKTMIPEEVRSDRPSCAHPASLLLPRCVMGRFGSIQICCSLARTGC